MCWSMHVLEQGTRHARHALFFFTAAPTFGLADGTPWSRATVTDSGQWTVIDSGHPSLQS